MPVSRRVGRSGASTVPASTAPSGSRSQSRSGAPSVDGAFPLSVSANARFLQTPGGTPFRLQTDAGWFMVCNFADADVTTYLDSLVSHGFTAFILMNIVHSTDPGHWAPLNQPNDFYNNAPFTTPGHFDTPNAAYFARVKSAIDQALTRGLAVKFFHTYIGASGATDGWVGELNDAHNTNTVCFNWGVYLATTFTQPNIIWMHGGDNFLSGTPLARFQQIVAGIQSVTRNRIAGSEWNGPDSLITDQAGFAYGTNPATSDMQLDSFYGGGPLNGGGGITNHTYVTADSSWSRASPVLPSDIEEPAYVNAWYFSINRNYDIRNAYFWAELSGAIAGATFGEDNRWGGQSTALSTFTQQGTVERGYANTLFQSLPWHRMRPSGTATGYAGRLLVVAGAGSGDSTISSCMTDTGSHMLVFVPRTDPTATTTFSIDLRSMAPATVRTRWWNPTTGVYTTAGAGSYANTLSAQSFTTPGANGSTDSVNGLGSNDWLLVVDS